MMEIRASGLGSALEKEFNKNLRALEAVSVNLARQGGALNETLDDTTTRIEGALRGTSERLATALDNAAAAADRQAAQLARWTKVLAWATIVLTVATVVQAAATLLPLLKII